MSDLNAEIEEFLKNGGKITQLGGMAEAPVKRKARGDSMEEVAEARSEEIYRGEPKWEK